METKRPTLTNTTRFGKNGVGVIFMASCSIFIVFLFTIATVNEIRFESISNLSRCISPTTNITITTTNTTTTNTTLRNNGGNDDELRVFIGILTLPDQYRRRDFLRQVYGVQFAKLPPWVRVDLKFVFCNLTKDDQHFLVALEILHYDDIIILNCTEHMNKGKSFNYFASLPSLIGNTTNTTTNEVHPPYHYVMKTDDDTYFRVERLVRSLMPLSRHDLYYGYVIPCESMDPFKDYMSGMGYLVSWDVVEWLRDQSGKLTPAELVGPEDMVLGHIIGSGGRGKNRFNTKWAMYNYPDPPDQCTHALWPETVAVHKLKTQDMWIKTLRYFNFTMDLKPSKFYHIDHP